MYRIYTRQPHEKQATHQTGNMCFQEQKAKKHTKHKKNKKDTFTRYQITSKKAGDTSHINRKYVFLYMKKYVKGSDTSKRKYVFSGVKRQKTHQT